MQLIDQFRDQLANRKFTQCCQTLNKENIDTIVYEGGYREDYPFLLEVYDSPDFNCDMTNFIRYLIEQDNLEMILRTGSDESVLSRTIQFNAEELFDLLKVQKEIVYGSSPQSGLIQAVNCCSNPRIIYECFRLNLLDLQYTNFNFLQNTDPYFVEIARFLLDSETLDTEQQMLIHALRILTAKKFSREETVQKYLEMALLFENLPVSQYFFERGIKFCHTSKIL